ncbi:primase C-terminal domain-containing protein [Roseiconus lacunae]|uniref:primase C-terminal domain-containing protein n=1 Tax=Roseiconus lacunae TaxID=2605694 RepID=UPI0030890E63|nr:primase C-terminal domain-containing protein [Stieleria sp. HD01]
MIATLDAPGRSNQEFGLKTPSYIRNLRQWITWEMVNETKIPKQLNGENARTNDPSTFESYDAVQHLEKKAFVIQADDDLTGIDLDGCLEERDGEIIVSDWAKPIIDRLCPVAYGEISPSGSGIKFLTFAKKVRGAKCVHKFGEGKQQLEAYDKARFWAMTGDYWLGSQFEIGDGQEAVDWICEQYLMPSRPVRREPAPVSPGYKVGISSGVLSRGADYVERAESPGKGDRNNAAFRLAGCLRAIDDSGQRLSEDEIEMLMRRWNCRLSEPLDEKELLSVIRSSAVNGTAREAKTNNHVDMPTQDLGGVDFSQLGSAPAAPIESDQEEVQPVPVEPVVTVFGLDLESTADAPRSSPDNSHPAWAFEDEGIIGQVVDYTLQKSLYPQPELAFAGALSLMATITGQAITDLDYGTRTNLYVVGIAPSGSGKEQARKTNKELMRHAGALHMLGPERIASHAGIVSQLNENPVRLFQLDEIGRLFATLKNPSKSPHLYNIASVLMQVYSSSDQTWIGDAYADTRNVKTIHQPHAVIYGTTVAENFWGSLTAENVTDGLLGRIMPFESIVGKPRPKTPSPRISPDSHLIESIQWWTGQPRSLNVESCDVPLKAVHTSEAAKRFRQHMDRVYEKSISEPDDVSAVWSRSPGKAGKLALLLAASRQTQREDIQISLEDVERAIAISNWLTRRLLHAVEGRVCENQQEERTKRVLRMLKAPMTATQISRKTQWLKKREREEVLDTLLESGQVVFWEKRTKGRPIRTYICRENFHQGLLEET